MSILKRTPTMFVFGICIVLFITSKVQAQQYNSDSWLLNPEWALVGEVFGTEGEVTAIPEYKIGVRWEPNQHAAWAITYGQEFNGNEGAGNELGVMIFTPQFACFGPCKIKR